MLLDNILPGPHLNNFVRCYRIINFFFPDFEKIPFKAYTPRPEHCLQFYPRDPEIIRYPDHNKTIASTKISLVGQHTIVNNRYVGKDFLTVQVVFQPGALFRLKNISSEEITNIYMDAQAIFGREICFVNEQLFHAKTCPEMIEIVEQFLYIQIKKAKRKETHPIDDICKMMTSKPGNHSLDWYIKEACICHRQFDRKFKQRIGIGPKQFLRVTRFDKAFRMKNLSPDKDWLTIALHCGYYDYQHLSKDYKEFTGLSPAAFFEIEKEAPERVFGEAEV